MTVIVMSQWAAEAILFAVVFLLGVAVGERA